MDDVLLPVRWTSGRASRRPWTGSWIIGCGTIAKTAIFLAIRSMA